MEFWKTIFFLINIISICYFLFITISYAVSSLLSSKDVLKYRKESLVEDYDSVISSAFAPSVSIIAPAYNESLSIADCIRSFLTLKYVNYKIIIVNDGSKDNTLEVAIKAFDLVKIDYDFTPSIETQAVRGIYASTNPAFSKLIMVDKVNGRKSDALNVGINVAKSDYVLCIDVDSILVPDTIQKMIKPILAEPHKKVVGVGGIVWLTNDAVVKDGVLKSVHAPSNFVNRIQVLEYIRAFLITRPMWVRFNALPIISGAIGLYDRKIIKEVGGFDIKTPGEDLEIVMRLHKIMQQKKENYLISYVPEPLCWTEGPSSYKDLAIQRKRWSWSAVYAFFKHKEMHFNPKYKVYGTITYPYFLYSDIIAPIIEVLGFLLVIVLLSLGILNLKFVAIMLFFIYAYTVLYSTYSFLIQDLCYGLFKKPKDVLMLFGTILLEPIYHHPQVVYWGIVGIKDFFFKKNMTWTGLTRVGLTGKK